jgi:hypothetical protein
MPKIPMDYKNTIMYKFVCNDLNVTDCYVGHTVNMTKRKCWHKFACNNEKSKGHNRKIYKIIRENGGWENWSMLLVEEFPCKDNHEACKREREIFEELDAKMNTRKPYRTDEELKEELKQNHKQYYQIHKEELKQYDKQYREDHKEEIKEYNKQYSKQYREENKEDLKKYHKKYREENKEDLKKKWKEKIECKYCAKLLSKVNMSRHIKRCKSKPVKNYIEEK